MNALCSFFSWRGTINRREYIHHAAIATAVFALGCSLHVSYEPAIAHALGIPDDTPLSLLFMLPFVVEIVATIGCPFTLPVIVLCLFTAADGQLAEEAADMAAASPMLYISIFAVATLLMLLAGLRNLALAARRMRDAGSSLMPLAAIYGGVALLYVVLFVTEQPHPAALSIYLLALLAAVIAQCVLLFRSRA